MTLGQSQPVGERQCGLALGGGGLIGLPAWSSETPALRGAEMAQGHSMSGLCLAVRPPHLYVEKDAELCGAHLAAGSVRARTCKTFIQPSTGIY